MLAVRIIVGIYLIIHGLCHLVGFVVPWKIATLKEEPYKTTLLAGAVDIGDAGIRAVGILWLLAAAGFAAGAVGVFGQWVWWRPLTMGLSIVSLVLCVLGLPGAKIGILANAIIIMYLVVGGKFGWVPAG
ncbi:MAG TPA: ABC transporter permease [Spirochaetota bacterium]|nr:ABC transporter permease [Spirochaetota bacterium]